MSKTMNKIIFIFTFVFAFLVFSGENCRAKVSSSEVFKVEVGDDDLPLNYVLVRDLTDNEVKEQIQFNVLLNGLKSTGNSYSWEHQLCYKFADGEEICEIDITAGNIFNSTDIVDNKSYSFAFYDTDMPYYSDAVKFSYVTFKNKFTCLNCEEEKEYILDDITFLENEINYKYKFDFINNSGEVDGKEYASASKEEDMVKTLGVFVNNSTDTGYTLDKAPTYKLINEICVGENICKIKELETYNSKAITPYSGNVYVYYYDDHLKYVNDVPEYEFAKYKTTLQCVTNCGNSRVDNDIVLLDKTFHFDYTIPEMDEENTKVDTYNELIYIKNSEVKITFTDTITGIDDSRLKYYIVDPYYNSCDSGVVEEYSFVNGESFTIGDGLNGGYCMYYLVYDVSGNYYRSNYFIYYFDNIGPDLTVDRTYETNKYYNEVKVVPTARDDKVDFKEMYYLWSKEEIKQENYLVVKNQGTLYESGEITSRELSEDGVYYLYFLVYDTLDNYKLYRMGPLNIDTTGLSIEEIVIETSNFNDNYTNTGTIKVSVEQMESGAKFKCAFLKQDTALVDELTMDCYNGESLTVSNNLSGEYNFFVYVKDRADNYSLIRLLENLKIDTIGPDVIVEILYNDDSYRILNEITINVDDISGVNSSSLKYGWFLKSKTNVVSSDLSASFISGESFGYPVSYYGEYKLYVSAIDSLGNETFKACDKIFKIDTDVIRISLVGEDNVTILRGQEYEELGARAYKGDVASGGRVSDIKVEGSVNNKKAGVYYITYSSGEGDLLVSVTRKVVVKSDTNYMLVTGIVFGCGLIITCLRLFVRRKRG